MNNQHKELFHSIKLCSWKQTNELQQKIYG